MANLWIVAPYSFKKGGIDWLIQNKEKEWVGLLHAYDFSKENYAHRHRWCTIGFMMGAAFRGTGVAQEAVQQLQSYLCLLYTSPSPRDLSTSRMPSSA